MDTIQNKTPEEEIKQRIRKLQHYLAGEGGIAALIAQNTDLYYFTGTSQQGYLFVPPQGDPLLMVKKSSARAKTESPLPYITELKSASTIPDLIEQNGHDRPAALGMELDVLPTDMYFRFKKIFKDTEIIDVSDPIRRIRAVKSSYEIDVVRQAAKFSDMLADYMKEVLREGISEVALAGKMEARARELGHQGVVKMRLWGAELFYGHLMAGPAAAVPSYLASPTGGAGLSPAVAQGSSFRPIRRHEPVLFDYTFAWNGYISDETRIFSIGELPDELTAAHEAMLSLQEIIKTEAAPGKRTGALYETAVEYVKNSGYADYFMGSDHERVKFIGHGVGLELDEYPFIAKGQDMLLESGMIVAIEPKLIFPGKGVVGVENTYLVDGSGLEQLTNYEESVIVL